MDFTAIAAANQSLNVIKTLVEGFISIRDESKVQQLRFDMQNAVIGVQSTVLDLLQKLAEAQEENRLLLLTKNKALKRCGELEDLIAEKESCELYELRPGAFVYAQKAAMGETPKPPYFCQACRASGVHMALLRNNGGNVSYGTWYCPTAKAHNISFGTTPLINYSRLGGI